MLKKIGLCAIVAFGLISSAAYAQQDVVKRTELQKMDYPGTQYATILVMADITANSTVARHTHPGVETAYVMEGEGDFSVEGKPDKHVKPGDSFQTAAAVPHSFKSGAKPVKILLTYVVEKDKPLASPAPK